MKDLFNKYKHSMQRLHSLQVKQFKIEEHLKSHKYDYTAVIRNELVKGDIYREEEKLQGIKKRLSIEEDVF